MDTDDIDPNVVAVVAGLLDLGTSIWNAVAWTRPQELAPSDHDPKEVAERALAIVKASYRATRQEQLRRPRR